MIDEIQSKREKITVTWGLEAVTLRDCFTGSASWATRLRRRNFGEVVRGPYLCGGNRLRHCCNPRHSTVAISAARGMSAHRGDVVYHRLHEIKHSHQYRDAATAQNISPPRYPRLCSEGRSVEEDGESGTSARRQHVMRGPATPIIGEVRAMPLLPKVLRGRKHRDPRVQWLLRIRRLPRWHSIRLLRRYCRL